MAMSQLLSQLLFVSDLDVDERVMQNQFITLPLFDSHTVNQIADKTLRTWARSQLPSQLLFVSDLDVDDSVLQNQSNTLPLFDSHTVNQIADNTLHTEHG
jgi:hypothetical protein